MQLPTKLPRPLPAFQRASTNKDGVGGASSSAGAGKGKGKGKASGMYLCVCKLGLGTEVVLVVGRGFRGSLDEPGYVAVADPKRTKHVCTTGVFFQPVMALVVLERAASRGLDNISV